MSALTTSKSNLKRTEDIAVLDWQNATLPNSYPTHRKHDGVDKKLRCVLAIACVASLRTALQSNVTIVAAHSLLFLHLIDMNVLNARGWVGRFMTTMMNWLICLSSG